MQQVFLLGAVKPLPYFYLITVTLGVLFTFISPDTDRSVLGDLGLWLSQTLIPLSSILVAHLFLTKIPRFNQFTSLWKLVISGLLGVVIYLPAALWIDAQFDNQPLPNNPIHLVWEIVGEFGSIAPPILIAWLAMNAPWLLGLRFERENSPDSVPPYPSVNSQDPSGSQQTTTSNQSDSIPLFFPEKLHDIIYLKAELHYLLVTTVHGKRLELYNLRDAVELLNTVDGLSPHRSWWVNKRYIERYVANGRQGKLLLKGDHEVPVSRRKIPETKVLLKQWGILPP